MKIPPSKRKTSGASLRAMCNRLGLPFRKVPQEPERDWHAEGWQYVFYMGFGLNPNCKHDAEYEFRRGENFWTGRLADQHPAFNIAGGLMFRPLARDVVIDE